jgi:hypothetical protein
METSPSWEGLQNFWVFDFKYLIHTRVYEKVSGLAA